MRGICLDEHELWFEWFESDGALNDFLESLMEPMYDYLRPRTIHETKLEKLCELCATIQARYMDVDADDDDDNDNGWRKLIPPRPEEKSARKRELQDLLKECKAMERQRNSERPSMLPPLPPALTMMMGGMPGADMMPGLPGAEIPTAVGGFGFGLR